MINGKQAISCGFIKIGAEKEGIFLTDLIPTCEQSDGDIVVEMLNELGVTEEGQIYSFFLNSRGNDDGWWTEGDDQIGVDVDDIFFPAGTGLWVTGIEDAKWNSAGQVYDADKEITLHDGKQMLANPYPTNLLLAESIWIDCDQSDGDIVVELLNELGQTQEGAIYSFFLNSRGNDDGWWTEGDDQIGVDVDDIAFPAGKALWVTGMDDAKFQITSPLK